MHDCPTNLRHALRARGRDKKVGGIMKGVAAIGFLVSLAIAAPAAAQKQGGVLRMHQREGIPSMSIHEEGTISTVLPMMGVFNNLVVYDPKVPQNSLKSIIGDLATEWSWQNDG